MLFKLLLEAYQIELEAVAELNITRPNKYSNAWAPFSNWLHSAFYTPSTHCYNLFIIMQFIHYPMRVAQSCGIRRQQIFRESDRTGYFVMFGGLCQLVKLRITNYHYEQYIIVDFYLRTISTGQQVEREWRQLWRHVYVSTSWLLTTCLTSTSAVQYVPLTTTICTIAGQYRNEQQVPEVFELMSKCYTVEYLITNGSIYLSNIFTFSV